MGSCLDLLFYFLTFEISFFYISSYSLRVISSRENSIYSSYSNWEDIFESDDGARFVGEFAIGFNPYIKEAMKDILFDEKIAGSMHFTPGNSYDDACNGNKSEVHWDLVLIQRPEYGGGTISFDGEVIRKDGIFVKESLLGLNPENLIGECCTV